MLEERFQFNGVSGTVRRLPKLRAEIGASQYVAAIMRAQGAQTLLDQLTSDVYAFKIFTTATDFANVAVRLQDVAGLPFAFPHSSAKDAEINAAFEWYVDSDGELWAHLQDVMKRLDRPNGAAGAPAEALSEAEAASPLSVPSAPNGSNG